MARFALPRRLAAAVSGGRDSLALTLLAQGWARAAGRELLAFTVDHGLRAESAAEAAQVAAWLAARGVPCRVLRWEGPKPATGVQAAAREARYALLLAACREAGVDALLLGHQLEDQAETFLMRLARGGGDGLAAMAAEGAREGVRLLRPLLGVQRARLTAVLRALGQPWLDDPSNSDPRFERTRIRALAAELGPERLAAAAEAARAARAALDAEAETLIARAARIDPAGWAIVDGEAFRRHPAGARALRLLLHAIGGDPYAPGLARVPGALADLGRRGRTLAHCRIAPWRGGALICREARDLPPPAPLPPGGRVRWDRFALSLGPEAPSGIVVAALGADAPRGCAPAPARAALPCLRLAGEVVALPHLGAPQRWNCRLEFRPSAPLPRIGFRVA